MNNRSITGKLVWVVCLAGATAGGEELPIRPPELVTAETRADRQRLAELQQPGEVFFQDDFETEASWGRYDPPGYMFLYTYWMDMRRDRDGNYWGNMLGPVADQRVVLERDRWYCLVRRRCVVHRIHRSGTRWCRKRASHWRLTPNAADPFS